SPCPTPGILIVVVLPPAPSHSHGAENQLAEAASFKRLPEFDDRDIESVLFDHEESHAVQVARGNHGVSVVKRQRHGLFHNNVLPVRCQSNHVLRMISTLGEHHNDIHLLATHHLVHIGVGRHLKLASELVCLLHYDVTDGSQRCPVDLPVAEQLGVPLCDTPAAHQADSQHFVSARSEEHTSELQSPYDLVCRLLLEKKNCSTVRSRDRP